LKIIILSAFLFCLGTVMIKADTTSLITVGPYASHIKGSGISTSCFGGEGTIAVFNKETFLSWWLSFGGGSCKNIDSDKTVIYGETGFYYILNIGLGYKTGVAELTSPYVFIGAPIPIPVIGENVMPFVEPYMRKHFGAHNAVEYGIQFKCAITFK
jgi:hypothetical protein